MSEIELKNCPFCGSTDIDPEGVASFKEEHRKGENTWTNHSPEMIEHHPACNNCNATAAIKLWDTRPLESALQAKLDKAVSALEWISRQRYAGWESPEREKAQQTLAEIRGEI